MRTGWVQEEGGKKLILQVGDVVWTPPGVRHWHGATDATAFGHITIRPTKDGKNVVWMEAATGAEYAGPAGPRAEQRAPAILSAQEPAATSVRPRSLPQPVVARPLATVTSGSRAG